MKQRLALWLLLAFALTVSGNSFVLASSPAQVFTESWIMDEASVLDNVQDLEALARETAQKHQEFKSIRVMVVNTLGGIPVKNYQDHVWDLNTFDTRDVVIAIALQERELVLMMGTDLEPILKRTTPECNGTWDERIWDSIAAHLREGNFTTAMSVGIQTLGQAASAEGAVCNRAPAVIPLVQEPVHETMPERTLEIDWWFWIWVLIGIAVVAVLFWKLLAWASDTGGSDGGYGGGTWNNDDASPSFDWPTPNYGGGSSSTSWSPPSWPSSGGGSSSSGSFDGGGSLSSTSFKSRGGSTSSGSFGSPSSTSSSRSGTSRSGKW